METSVVEFSATESCRTSTLDWKEFFGEYKNDYVKKYIL